MRRALASVAFGHGFCAAWLVCALTRLPLPWYLPVEHRWTFAIAPPTLGMDFYGRLLVATAAGVLTAVGGAALARPGRERWLEAAAASLPVAVLLNLVVQLAGS
ncbi:MAG: hypothetical protein QM723_08620 [Myxococcaceae bacterium]